MTDLIWSILRDIKPGRLIESLIFLAVCIWKLKPHLKKIEDRMKGIESSLTSFKDTVTLGFTQGNSRFAKIETRLDVLEIKPKNGDKEVSNVSKDH